MINPTLPGATLGLRPLGDHANNMAIVYAVEGEPSGGVIGAQSLEAAQVALAIRIDPASMATLLYGTYDGGTTWTPFTGVAFDPQDGESLTFGTGNDIAMAWDGTRFNVTQAAPNSEIRWGVDGAGIDQTWYGDTASGFMRFDQSADSLILTDNYKLVMGTGSDITATWNGTKLLIGQAAANSAIDFGVDGAGIDLVLYGDTASAAVTWDQSADKLVFSGVAKLQLQTIAAADAAAIPVTHSGSLPITTAAAETNTLADPSHLGQTISLFVDTYAVGDRVITAASRINQAGNTIITLGAAGDFIKLEAITIGGALKWQVIANDGAALSGP